MVVELKGVRQRESLPQGYVPQSSEIVGQARDVATTSKFPNGFQVLSVNTTLPLHFLVLRGNF
jgi:hypothetical protein